MSIHADTTHPIPDWQRVTSLSATFSAHALALMVLALPLAAPLVHQPPPMHIEANLIAEPPPAPPLPPEPQPLPRVQPMQPPVHVPRATPDPIPVTATTMPTPIASVPTQVPDVAVDIRPAATPATSGETRTLAYDGALKLHYPPVSVRQREQGTVVLHVLVDADGNAQRIEIARSSGHRRLDDAARDAVRHAHFRPVLLEGKAQPAWGLVPIEFRLDRG